jgi:hypothetical protein
MLRINCILLILFSATSFAKWEGGYLSDDGKMSLYYDNETIDINYPRFRIWSLMDFNSPINKNINSAKILTEYNCEELQRRVVHIISYSKNMGEGTIISEATASQDWGKFIKNEGSSSSNVFNTICGKE